MTHIILVLIFGHLPSPTKVSGTEFLVSQGILNEYSLHNVPKHWHAYIRAFVHFALTNWTKTLTLSQYTHTHRLTLSYEYFTQKSSVFTGLYSVNGGVESWEKTTWNREQV